MLESLQGRGVPRQFVISRRSGNVTFRWTRNWTWLDSDLALAGLWYKSDTETSTWLHMLLSWSRKQTLGWTWWENNWHWTDWS